MSWSTIKQILALRCDESTRLISEGLDRDLPFGERLAVRLHAVSCGPCRRYRKQLALLREAFKRCWTGSASLAAPGESLSDEAHRRIEQTLADSTAE